MQLIMTKTSPQFIRSAAASVLAMAAFAFASPVIEAHWAEAAPAAGATGMPSLTAAAGALVR